MRVNSLDATIQLFIVSDSTMQTEVILGRDLIGRNDLNVTLLKDRVLLAKISYKISRQAKGNEDENNIFLIDTNILVDSQPLITVNEDADYSVIIQMLHNFQNNLDVERHTRPEVQL